MHPALNGRRKEAGLGYRKPYLLLNRVLGYGGAEEGNDVDGVFGAEIGCERSVEEIHYASRNSRSRVIERKQEYSPQKIYDSQQRTNYGHDKRKDAECLDVRRSRRKHIC